MIAELWRKHCPQKRMPRYHICISVLNPSTSSLSRRGLTRQRLFILLLYRHSYQLTIFHPKKKKTTKPPFPHECVQFTWMCPPHTCHFSLRWQFLIYKSFPLFNRILTQRTKATKVKGTHRFNAERSTREPERGRREAVAGNYRTLFFSAEASGVSRKIFLFFQKNEKHKRERSRVAKNNGERDIESQS